MALPAINIPTSTRLNTLSKNQRFAETDVLASMFAVCLNWICLENISLPGYSKDNFLCGMRQGQHGLHNLWIL